MEHLERYSRQMLFQPIGKKGQMKLLESRVVIVGMGALGTVIADHLVRAGVGFVRMIDRDYVELSNLQRQSLFDEVDAAEQLPKVIAAERKLQKINSTVTIEPIVSDLNLDNAEDLLGGVDIIVDGTDNFSTRFLINDVAVKLGIPWVHGAAVSSRGMFSIFIPGKTPCYRCLFPDVPAGRGETCDTVGVLAPLTHIIASFEAIETIKYLVGASHNPNLQHIDIWDTSFMEMDISGGKNPNCPCCVERKFEFLDRASEQQTTFAVLCGRNTVQINPRNVDEFHLEELAEKLKKVGTVKGNRFLLRFSPEEDISLVFFKDGRVLVHGVDNITDARTYYAKYVGS